jgi:hypothetical protein
MSLHHLRLTAPAATIEASDLDARTLTGVAVPYGEAGNTSAGRLEIDPGAIRVPDQLRRVKLFREHGRTAPVGFAASSEDTPAALRMAFHVANTPDGDRALLEASEGVRDALSVELDNVTIEAGHVVSADLVCVAQVPVPAYAGAILTASDQPEPAGDPAADPGGVAGEDDTETDPEDDPETDDPDAGDTEQNTTQETEDTMPETTETTVEGARLTGMVPAATRPAPAADRRLWAANAAEAIRGATDAAQVNAALADITPANSGSDNAGPPGWIGELWTPQAASRKLVDAIGVAPLTGMVMQGWKWITEPAVAPYAGNKAAIPTSPAQIGPAEATAQRIAGGWDLDRIYVDFNTGFLAAFQEAAIRDYKRKSQSYFIDGHAAVVGPPAVPAADGILTDAADLGSAPDLTAAINTLVSYLTGNGAQVSFLALASDVYADFLQMTGSEAPWWLQNQGSISFNGSASVGGTAVAVDPTLPAGTLVGGDSDAVSLWETGPINVQAVNLPNGGIDFALFGYWAQMVHDDDGLAKITVAGTTTAAASEQGSKRK